MTRNDWLLALALAMMCGGLSFFGWRFWLGLNGKAGLLSPLAGMAVAFAGIAPMMFYVQSQVRG